MFPTSWWAMMNWVMGTQILLPSLAPHRSCKLLGVWSDPCPSTSCILSFFSLCICLQSSIPPREQGACLNPNPNPSLLSFLSLSCCPSMVCDVFAMIIWVRRTMRSTTQEQPPKLRASNHGLEQGVNPSFAPAPASDSLALWLRSLR